MITWYRTEADAFARVRRLRRELGIWPGVVGPVTVTPGGGFSWRLTYDPPLDSVSLWRGQSQYRIG